MAYLQPAGPAMKRVLKPATGNQSTLENTSGQEASSTTASTSSLRLQSEDMQPKDSCNEDESLQSASMILFNELPDPEQKIAIERGYDTDTFTCFPLLPFELRIKIWRYSYPAPKTINLLPRCQGYCLHELFGLSERHRIGDSSRFQTVTVRRARVPLPITLRINRESRQETLIDYVLVIRHKQDLRSGKGMTVVRIDNGPFCFDPLRDIIFINWCSFRWLPNISQDFTFGWVSQLEYKKEVKRIFRLEIRKMVWCRILLLFLQLYNSGDLGIFDSSTVSRDFWDHAGPLRHLLKFPSLRTIHVTLQFPSFAEEKASGGRAVASEICKEEMVKFLEKYKAKFGGEVPTVTVSFFKPLYQQIPYRTF